MNKIWITWFWFPCSG